ncbi:MAG: acyl--CoA ligase [Rhodospirillaceae bacterium]|jgi:acyl-CoA synthetase (AMP-forming)/AMP-acid ligase II|nr:acyl--CoA ligase [Rhodospirillaceae bacterium]MBT6118033.1 acyl--CoA ligase [Rhodospirillaceae bacterium]
MLSLGERRAEHRALEARPFAANLGALLDEAAARFGDAPCLVFFEAGLTLSFAELREQANRAANALHALGIAKGDRVAVMLPNGPAFPVAWLALARLGAVLVPVNNRYTARELRYLLEDSGVGTLVIHPDYLPVFDGIGDRAALLPDERVLLVDGVDPRFSNRWDAMLAAAAPDFAGGGPVGRDDLLNIQYTSGTTGFPKGCMLTHLYWLMCGRVACYTAGFTPKRLLMGQYFYYMDPLFLLVIALEHGAAYYVCSRPSTSRFMRWVAEHDIELCLIFEFVYKQPPHPRDAENRLVHAWLFGLTPENHADLEQRFGIRARELFGMTEIGVGSYMPADHDHMVGSGLCGIAVPFRELRVARADGTEAAPGEAGELWVRGPGMMLGYYDKPEANAEAFSGDWFRTGDLFTRDAAGYHRIVGRLKDMVRRSGENIAAREVEAVLRAMPEIEEAAVLPVPDEDHGEEVKAYVSLMPGVAREDAPPERILAHCEAGLARFKLPRYIAYVEGFSKTVSDRVEKKALIAGVADLRAGAYDRVEGRWR